MVGSQIRIPAVAIFRKIIFKENFLKIMVKVTGYFGKREGRRGAKERGEAKYT